MNSFINLNILFRLQGFPKSKRFYYFIIISLISFQSLAAEDITELFSKREIISIRLPQEHLNKDKIDLTYTYAMSNGNPAPKLIAKDSSTFYLAYNDSNSNGIILQLDSQFKVINTTFHFKNKRIEDFALDKKGIILLLTEFDIKPNAKYLDLQFHTAHIQKISFDGKSIFNTKIVGTKTYDKVGDQGIDTTFGNFNIAISPNGDYSTYFSTYRKWDDGVVHQSEYLAFFDSAKGERILNDSGKYPLGFTWNVSHSFRPIFASDGKNLILATTGDAYPRGLVVQEFPAGKRDLPIEVAKAKPGETYQYVPVSTGDIYAVDGKAWITFDSSYNRSDYDIGLVIREDGKSSKPIYLTNSKTKQSRIPRIIPYTKDAFLVLWMNDSGPSKSKWFPYMKNMSLAGAIIDKDGNIISQEDSLDPKGNLRFRSSSKLFRLPDGRLGWINDLTGVADQLELILVSPDGKIENTTVSNNDSTNSIDSVSSEDSNSFTPVKINPNLNEDLIASIYEDNETKSIELLKKGADPNAAYQGWTALLYSAYFGRTNVVAELIKRKANPDSSYEGWTALQLSDARGHSQITELLKPITNIKSRSLRKQKEVFPSNPNEIKIGSRSIRKEIKSPNLKPKLSTLGSAKKLK